MNEDDIQAALHHQQQLEQQEFEEQLKPYHINLAYCDKIASVIKDALNGPDPDGIVAGCGKVHSDLHPDEGWLQSTKKSMTVMDKNGKFYQVTVEEL